jgi:hypothetical protein
VLGTRHYTYGSAAVGVEPLVAYVAENALTNRVLGQVPGQRETGQGKR